VPDEYLDDVDRWFTKGNKIIALDSAVCYLAYSGYLWPDIEGDIGKVEYWDYVSCFMKAGDDVEGCLAEAGRGPQGTGPEC